MKLKASQVLLALFTIIISGVITQTFLSSLKKTNPTSVIPPDAIAFIPSPPDSPNLYSVTTKNYQLDLGSKIKDPKMDPDSLPQTQISLSSGQHTFTSSLISRLSVKPILAATSDSKEISIRLDSNSSVSYQAIPQGIKENIILQNRQAPNEFLFSLDAQNIEMRKNLLDEGRWYFYDIKTQKPIFFLPHPFATDADGETTYNLSIKKIYQNQRFYFKLILDKGWLYNTHRAFPVTIDPTVEVVTDPKEEIAESRTINTKLFKDETKTFTLKSAIGPVHYRDPSQGWQEIDPHLSPQTDPDYQYAMLRSDVKMQFSRSLLKQPFLKLSHEDTTLDISLDQNLPYNSNHPEPILEDNTITYPQILPGISLRYTIGYNLLLEEFIADNPESALRCADIIQKLNVPDSTFQQNPNGSIDFFRQHSRTLLWTIPVPKMYDDQSTSLDIEIKAIRQPDNLISLQKIIKPDGRSWLESPDRHYPLVVDASVTRYTSANTDDALSWTTSALDGVDEYDVNDGGSTYHVGVFGYNYIFGVATSKRDAGLRFTNIAIGQSYAILSAVVTYRAWSNRNPACNINIYCEAADNSAALNSASWPSARTTTTSAIGFTLPATSYSWHDTTDLSAPVREVIGRAGWASGNALTFLFLNTYAARPCDTADTDLNYPYFYDAAHLTHYNTLTINFKQGNSSIQIENTKIENTKIITD